MIEKALFTPLELGRVTLKNRIIFAPTSLGLSREDALQKLREIAAGGCAMVIIGDVPVGSRGFLSLHTKKGFAHYQNLCKAIHDQGSMVCAQLHQSDSNFKALLKFLPGLLMKKMTPDDLRSLLNAQTGPYITNLSTEKVKSITASFGPAAVLAHRAGFPAWQ